MSYFTLLGEDTLRDIVVIMTNSLPDSQLQSMFSGCHLYNLVEVPE